jgi:predicted enzyme related to lactoylglutathione lyase
MSTHSRATILAATAFVAITALVVQLSPVQAKQADSHGGFTGDIKSVLYVSEVEASAQFFDEVLGFEFLGLANLASGEPYYAEFAANGRKFGLHEPINEEQEERVGQQRIYFRVRDLEAHRARLEARDVAVGETVKTDWMDFFIVRDADGHEIVIAVTDPERHGTDPW